MQKLFHVLEAQQFKGDWLEGVLFASAAHMKKTSRKKAKKILANREMVSFFYEPSTRTRMSFEIAMHRLGGKVVFSTENAKEFSSASKGETIEDTIRVICGYRPDVIVLRTDEEGMARRAADYSSVPIINAGDGTGQHPTQAMLDLYTISEQFGRVKGTWIAMVGDLARGRTVRSLAYLYAQFPDVKISFVSSELSKMRMDIKNFLRERGVWFEELYDLRQVADKVDVVYSTRDQKERGQNITYKERYEMPLSFSKVNQEVLNLMKKDAIIMHPLPRMEEIAPEVDKDPRGVYFRQAENGLYVRMALLKIMMEDAK